MPPAQTPPQAPPPPKNPYLDVVREMAQEPGQAAKANLKVGTRTAPDTTAEAARLAETLGIPLEVAVRNLDEAKRRAAVHEAPVDLMLRDTPHLAAWLGQSAGHASVVQDDLPQMGLLEWIATAPGKAFRQTLAQQNYADLRFQQMFGPLTDEQQKTMAAYKDAAKPVDVAATWFRRAIAGAGSFAANQVPVIKYGATGAAAGAAVGAPFGGLPGAAAGATAGGGLGTLTGVLQST